MVKKLETKKTEKIEEKEPLDRKEKSQNIQGTLQETYSKLQVLEQQMKGLQQQMQMIEEQFIDLKITERSIGEFKKLKKGDEMLAPLNGGIFIKTKFDGSNMLLINVGSNVIVEKMPEDAKKIVAEQVKQLNDVKEKLSNEMEKLARHGAVFQQELQNLASN